MDPCRVSNCKFGEMEATYKDSGQDGFYEEG